MDMKKKLDETYLPDKETRKSRVIVGLSGGLNSSVAAYLLKIQKYDLIGVTVAMGWDNFKDDTSGILACHLDQPHLDNIKEFCHQLGIPHVVVKASDEFKDEVVENWMTSRMTGSKANQCWNCHELRMRVLYNKVIEMDAQCLATGHLGKLFRQEAHHSVYVHTSNDEVHDQSSILSRLPHDILDKLMLPLSDLQQKEINKLAENFGLVTTPKKIKMHECFSAPNMGEAYLAANIPKRYMKPGEVVTADKLPVGEHQGIQHHKYGEVYQQANTNKNDIFYVTKYTIAEKKLEIGRINYFERKEFFLRNCKISEETSWLEPLKGVLKVGESEFIDCWIYPKNLSAAKIELETPHSILEGDIVTILKKKGKNSKVYLTGMVKYIAEDVVVTTDEGKERAKVDYANDF
jgi:tRNA-specific 2-thiouridylase